jgi:hypothetical protein
MASYERQYFAFSYTDITYVLVCPFLLELICGHSRMVMCWEILQDIYDYDVVRSTQFIIGWQRDKAYLHQAPK